MIHAEVTQQAGKNMCVGETGILAAVTLIMATLSPRITKAQTLP